MRSCSQKVFVVDSTILNIFQNTAYFEEISMKSLVQVLTTHLFFLQDDFLLQHFDCVEFIVCFELGEQDLHEGLFVSVLFSKHSLSTSTALRTLHQNPVGTTHPAQIRDLWKQMILGNLRSVLIQKKKNRPAACKHYKFGLYTEIQAKDINHWESTSFLTGNIPLLPFYCLVFFLQF